MDDGWVEELRGPHESEKEWTIKRSFLLAHKDNLDRERLICLATCFINMEMYGCGYVYHWVFSDITLHHYFPRTVGQWF